MWLQTYVLQIFSIRNRVFPFLTQFSQTSHLISRFYVLLGTKLAILAKNQDPKIFIRFSAKTIRKKILALSQIFRAELSHN